MKPNDWIAGMTVELDGFRWLLTERTRTGWKWLHVKTSTSGETVFSGWSGILPSTFAALGREPDGLMLDENGAVCAIRTRDGLQERSNEHEGCVWAFACADYSGGYPLDRATYEAAQAEPVSDDFGTASPLDGQTMSDSGHTWTTEERADGHICCQSAGPDSGPIGPERCPACQDESYSNEPTPTLCDDGRDVLTGCSCGDCIHCLARAEESEAWDFHALWLAVHAPAGDVEKRESEDAAEKERKRERDAWMWGIAR